MASQQPVEMILLRQVASYLTLPIWMMDEHGNLLYYNEPAEKLLGVTFDDAGPINAAQLADMFRATDVDGNPLGDYGLPVVAALQKRAPASGLVRFCGFDGIWRDVDIWAMPVEGQAGRFLGVFATFWESRD